MQESQKTQSSRQQKQQSLGNQKQIILGQDELDTYVGNLSEDINRSGLFELFGLRTTNYRCDKSDIQIQLSENTGKKKALRM